MLERWASMVFGLTPSCRAASRFVWPVPIRAATRRSVGVSRASDIPLLRPVLELEGGRLADVRRFPGMAREYCDGRGLAQGRHLAGPHRPTEVVPTIELHDEVVRAEAGFRALVGGVQDEEVGHHQTGEVCARGDGLGPRRISENREDALAGAVRLRRA